MNFLVVFTATDVTAIRRNSNLWLDGVGPDDNSFQNDQRSHIFCLEICNGADGRFCLRTVNNDNITNFISKVTNFDGLRSGFFPLGGGLHLFDCSDFLADGFPKCVQTFP
jgi:hypothetical protein